MTIPDALHRLSHEKSHERMYMWLLRRVSEEDRGMVLDAYFKFINTGDQYVNRMGI